MASSPKFAPPERYDSICAYCGDGKPISRYKGKGVCQVCERAIREGGQIPDTPVIIKIVIPEYHIQQLIRYLVHGDPYKSPIKYPLWQRAAVNFKRPVKLK